MWPDFGRQGLAARNKCTVEQRAVGNQPGSQRPRATLRALWFE
jgi:hypothetical protein